MNKSVVCVSGGLGMFEKDGVERREGEKVESKQGSKEVTSNRRRCLELVPSHRKLSERCAAVWVRAEEKPETSMINWGVGRVMASLMGVYCWRNLAGCCGAAREVRPMR